MSGVLHSVNLSNKPKGYVRGLRLGMSLAIGHTMGLEEGEDFEIALDEEDFYLPGGPDGIKAYWCRVMTTTAPNFNERDVSEGLLLQQVNGGPPEHLKRIGWMELIHTDDAWFQSPSVRSGTEGSGGNDNGACTFKLL